MGDLDHLLDFDRRAYIGINLGWQNTILDYVMLAASSHAVWAIAWILGIVWMIRAKAYTSLKYFLFVLVCVGMADFIVYQGFKPYFNRFRPCKVYDYARIVDGCAGWHSFPSNHATNAMLVAVMVMHRFSFKLGFLACSLAVLVGLSRVYLGAHYPFDILGGFVVGAVFATVGWYAYILLLEFTSKVKKDPRACIDLGIDRTSQHHQNRKPSQSK